jgi:hypothetical protein
VKVMREVFAALGLAALSLYIALSWPSLRPASLVIGTVTDDGRVRLLTGEIAGCEFDISPVAGYRVTLSDLKAGYCHAIR